MINENKIFSKDYLKKYEVFIQHECLSDNSNWRCYENLKRIDKLFLEFEYENPDDCEMFRREIEVKFCPFCGYEIKK